MKYEKAYAEVIALGEDDVVTTSLHKGGPYGDYTCTNGYLDPNKRSDYCAVGRGSSSKCQPDGKTTDCYYIPTLGSAKPFSLDDEFDA